MANSANRAVLASDYPDRAQASAGMNVDAEWTVQGSLTLNRFIPMFKLPPMKRIEAVMWDFPILDTNGSPTVKFKIGTSTTADQFVAEVTPGAAISKGSALSASGINFQTPANTETIVGITISVAAATTNAAPATPLYLRLTYKDA